MWGSEGISASLHAMCVFTAPSLLSNVVRVEHAHPTPPQCYAFRASKSHASRRYNATPSNQEKYLTDRVKVNGRTQNLTEGGITIARQGTSSLAFASTQVAVSKRYLKYLTKKFLKKNQLREYLRVVAQDKSTYVLKYLYLGEEADEE